MNNLEHAIEILENEHDPFAGPIDAPSLAYALNDAGLIADDPPALTRPMFPGGRVWYIEGPVGDVRATSDGKVVAFGTWQEQPFRIVSTPEKMRTLARTLEAAADHAQKEENDE